MQSQTEAHVWPTLVLIIIDGDEVYETCLVSVVLRLEIRIPINGEYGLQCYLAASSAMTIPNETTQLGIKHPVIYYAYHCNDLFPSRF